MSGRDYRDFVIETLADSEAGLREHIDTLAERAVVAEANLAAMRRVAVAGLHHAHDAHVELVGLRNRYHRALDDARRLRGRIIAADERKTAAA